MPLSVSLLAGSILPCCSGCGCQCKPKDGWYDKFFAGVMATGMDAYEEAVTPFKSDLLRNARFEGGGDQSVLEIGIGAAPNLQYLTRASFQEVAFCKNLVLLDDFERQDEAQRLSHSL